MSLISDGSDAKKIDLVELNQQDQLNAAVSRLECCDFGPCQIMPETWKWLKLAALAHGKNPVAKEVTFALLGQLRTDRFIIKGFVQLSGESGRGYSLFTTDDLKKIEAEAVKKGFDLIGILHTHPDSVKPSVQDRLAWLTLMFEFDRPMIYYILQPESLKLSAYSIPLSTFSLLKESIQPIECELQDK